MVDNIMAIGKMESNMEKVYIVHQNMIGEKEYGMKEKELDGLHLMIKN